jgi:hypothetical protein
MKVASLRDLKVAISIVSAMAFLCWGITNDLPLFSLSPVAWLIFSAGLAFLYARSVADKSLGGIFMDFSRLVTLFTISVSGTLALLLWARPEDRDQWLLGLTF